MAKHLYSYKYDYRDEWLKLIRTLSASDADGPLLERAVRAVCEPLESAAGGLWLRREQLYVPSAGELAAPDAAVEPADSAFLHYLAVHEWIVDVREQRAGERIPELTLPAWLDSLERAWLVVPLLRGSDLIGFVVLAEPRAPQRLGWEDLDLLKTISRQVAVDLAQFESARLLTEAEQFQAYHRFAAFMMHDLKNIAAQLALVVGNASRFKHRADFVDDAISTVDRASRRLSRLLDQLRRGAEGELVRDTDIVRLCADTAQRLGDRAPSPEMTPHPDPVVVRLGPEGFSNVLENVIRNAQEACEHDGSVRLTVTAFSDTTEVVVEDTGSGMDARFVRERLFRPFDTTKGSRGMGIGAHEAREFIRRAGGEVRVESEPGRGTRFIMTLPLAEAGREHEAQKLSSADGRQKAVDR